MARFTDLTDAEIQKKAEDLGVADAATLTRQQLEEAIVEKEQPDLDANSMAHRGHFVTPLSGQGAQTSGDTPPREEEPPNEVIPPTVETGAPATNAPTV